MKPTEKDIINDYRGGPKALIILVTMFVLGAGFSIVAFLGWILKTRWAAPVLVIILLLMCIFVSARFVTDLYVKNKKI